jgi:hypothetical protein
MNSLWCIEILRISNFFEHNQRKSDCTIREYFRYLYDYRLAKVLKYSECVYLSIFKRLNFSIKEYSHVFLMDLFCAYFVSSRVPVLF